MCGSVKYIATEKGRKEGGIRTKKENQVGLTKTAAVEGPSDAILEVKAEERHSDKPPVQLDEVGESKKGKKKRKEREIRENG